MPRLLLAVLPAALLAACAAPLAPVSAPATRPTAQTPARPALPSFAVHAQEVPTGSPHRLIGLDAAGSVVWAAGARGAWARSLDGGLTWTHGAVPGADTLQFRDVHAVDARRAVVLSIGAGTASRLYATDDGGASWTLRWVNPLAAAFFDCMAFDGRRGVAVSDAIANPNPEARRPGGTRDSTARLPLVETTDGGASWRLLPPDRWPRSRPGVGLFASSGTCALFHEGTLFFAGHRPEGRGASRVSWLSLGPDGRQAVSLLPFSSTDPMRGVATLAVRTERGQPVLYAGLLGAVDSVTVLRSELLRASDKPGDLPRLSGWKELAPLPIPRVYGLAASDLALVATGPDGLAVSTTDADAWVKASERDLWSAVQVGPRAFVAVGKDGLAVRIVVE